MTFGTAMRRRLSRRHTRAALALGTLFLALLTWFALQPPQPERTVRVGLYENAPKIYTDPDGSPAGLFAELLKEIAVREGWRLTFETCSWSDCLARLQDGELDLMPDVAFSAERSEIFAFHTHAVAHSWSLILVDPALKVHNVAELDGRRVALLAGAVQESPLAQLIRESGHSYEAVFAPTMHEAFELVARGEADAVVSNNFYAGWHNRSFGLRETPIVFNPVGLYFAASTDTADALLPAIDRHLERWRADANSPYYAALRRAMAREADPALPAYIQWALGASLAGVLILLTLTGRLRRQAVRRATQLDEQQARASYLAWHDPLTDLPNRALLRQRLAHALERAHSESSTLAVLLIDFDRFKNVNDSLGHSVGDTLLMQFAVRLAHGLRPNDTLARIGSDEFVLLLESPTSAHHASSVAAGLLARFGEPFAMDGHSLVVTASIGIALYPDDGDSGDALLMQAELAMHEAKKRGGHDWALFTPGLSEAVSHRLKLENALRQAIRLGQLHVHYQPQFALDDGHVQGVEALARWSHPELGPIPPTQFIAIAEEIGLIGQIDEWMLRAACRQLADWDAAGLHVPRVAVNLSVQDLEQAHCITRIERILAETGIDASRLEFEVTESMIMRAPERAAEVLAQLKRLGAHLAIDDFGTGYSSLAYLRRLPLDRLKIDRSFVCDIGESDSNEAIVRGIIALATSLGLRTVAEGVEHEHHRLFLAGEGCEGAQGYLFARPMPPEECASRLADRHGASGTGTV